MTGYYVEFAARKKAVLKLFEVPAIADDEVLIENRYTVVSAGTEGANFIQLPNTGTSEQGFPHRPGYSGAGLVIETGRDVKEPTVGERVIVNWGGHRSHTVKKARDVVCIDDESVDLLDAAFAHIASFPLLGVRKLDIKLGESALVVGMGILGAFAVQIAALSGAVPVVAMDFDPVRRALATELGAAAAFSPDEENVVEKIREATGGNGPDSIVEVTGSAAALRQGLEYIAWEGRISLLGCTRISDEPIDYYKYVHRRGITLVGSHTHTRPSLESSPNSWTEKDDYRTFIKLVSAQKIKTRPIISEVVSPESVQEIFMQIVESKQPPLGFVFDWSRIG